MRNIQIMGILNATPDSFYGGSRINLQMVADAAGTMIGQGASILDIGGQSTRPGAIAITAAEEMDRMLPALQAVKQYFPDISISVDTWYASVAEQAIRIGANIINDISAGDDDESMLDLVAAHNVGYVAMHKQGKPSTMQQNPVYNDVVADVLDYFSRKAEQFYNKGISNWFIDPGFGFGKNTAHNFALLRNLKQFATFNRPILVGISRKGMVWRTLNSTPEQALNGTTALHMAALINGANILRVHDVKEAQECITLYHELYGHG